MSNDQSNTPENNAPYAKAHELADGKLKPVATPEYRARLSVADLQAQSDATKPDAGTPAVSIVDPNRVYGFQDIRKGAEIPTPIDFAPGQETRYSDLVEEIRKKNYPQGEGKAPPLNGDGKATATLDDKGVFKVTAEGDIRDQEFYKVQQSYKIESVFQTEALPQNLSELNGLRPGYKLPLDIKDIGNGGTLSTLDATLKTRLDENTMGSATAKLNTAEKTATVGLGVENEVTGSKANVEASFKQVGDINPINQITQAKFSGEYYTLKGGMIGATGEFNFAPETGKLSGYDLSASLRPDGSFTTYKVGASEDIAANLKKFEFSAKSDSGTSLEVSTSKQATQSDTGSQEVSNQKLAFETKIYGGLEPIKKGEDKGDPRNLREDGTLSLSAEKTVTTTKKTDPQAVDAGGTPAQTTAVTEELKLAGSYKSTAGTEIGGNVKLKDGTVEEANAAFKTPVFVTKQPEPGAKDEDGNPKKPEVVKQGDISVSGALKNTATEKTLEVGAGYQDVKGNGVSGAVKTNTQTGEVISASGKLVSEIQDLKSPPDKDGNHKKIGTMTLEGAYDAPKKEATGKFEAAMDDKTGFKVSGTLDTGSGKLKKIDGETSFFVEGGAKILLGGDANFVDKTVGGKLGITAPNDKGSLNLSAQFKDINGTYELQKFQGSVQGKDDKGNITKIEGSIDNVAKKAEAKISYQDGASKNTYGAYANFEAQQIKEAGLTFAGKVGDPKMAQSDLKVGIAATFKDGRLDGGKVDVSLTPDNKPLDKKYFNNDSYFVGPDNVAKVMNIGKTTDPEARAKATTESVAKLDPKDKALYEQATKAVEQLNETKKLNLPVAETAASLTLLAKENKITDIAKAVDGNWVPGGSNIFIVSAKGERAEMKLNEAVNTNDQVTFNGIAKLNEEQKKAQAAGQGQKMEDPEAQKEQQKMAPIKQ